MAPALDIPALEVAHLTVSYGSTPALWDVDATFPSGAMSAIVGPNGSGKSTLIAAALGLVPSDSGRSTIFGRPAKEAMRRVAYVPQRSNVAETSPPAMVETMTLGTPMGRALIAAAAMVEPALPPMPMTPCWRCWPRSRASVPHPPGTP